MLIKKNIRIIPVLFTSLLLLGACAESKLKVEPIATWESPAERINRLENDIGNARKNQLNVLASTWFGSAETSLNDAKKALDRGDEITDILGHVAYGQAQLQRAEEMALLARTTLTDAITARDLARDAGATNLGEDYAEVETQFLELTKAIEDNDLDWARRNRGRITEAFLELELRAIKNQTLGEVRNLIDQADNEGAREIAPVTFADAQEQLREVEEFISKYRHQKEEMHKEASKALFQARRLLQVTRQSEKIQKMQPEQITLLLEGTLHKMATKLSAPDMRDQAFETQVENVLGSTVALQGDRIFMIDKVKAQQVEMETMNKRIASLEGQTRAEQSAKERLAAERQAAEERLAAERRFNELFSWVQSYFEPNEAEVYKQANQLVIRLRGIEFPVGMDVIMPSNYTLLSKVQRAIRTFGEPDVVIEGHTDSTGSEQANEHLSQRRADAVRQYLIANGTLPDEKIVAVGYGSMRPLASNETTEGRAVNRRIDVILTPQPQTWQ